MLQRLALVVHDFNLRTSWRARVVQKSLISRQNLLLLRVRSRISKDSKVPLSVTNSIINTATGHLLLSLASATFIHPHALCPFTAEGLSTAEIPDVWVCTPHMDPRSCFDSRCIWQMGALGVIFTSDNSRVLSLGVIHALPSLWMEARSEKTLGKSCC